MAKTIKQEGEATKVAIRLARKTVMEQIKKLPSKDAQRVEEKRVCVLAPVFLSSKGQSTSALHRRSKMLTSGGCLPQVQKITDDFIKDVAAMCESKEQQLQSIS